MGRDGEAARPVEIRPQCETRSRLADLPQAGFKFVAVPVKVCAFGAFPVRAFGLPDG
jgi:kynurenine formamidase